MNIIIVGAGKVGESLCADLSTEGKDIILIEKDKEILDNVLSSYDIMGIEGNGADYSILEEAGTSDCDIFIAVSPKDEINIIASVMAKKMGAKYTIARVRNIEYSQYFDFMKESMGIDMMLNPELEAAADIYRSLKYPSALSVESFFHGKVSMVSIRVRENSVLDNLQLKEFNSLSKHTNEVLVGVVERGEEVHIPNGEFLLQQGDIIHITGTVDGLFRFYSDIGEDARKITSCLIVGASKICYYLVEKLLRRNIKVKVIEVDKQQALRLTEQFDGLEVVLGDGTDPEFLKKQRFTDYDAVVSLTGIDEENILLSLLSKKSGVKKTITKVDRVNLLEIIGIVGLQTVITPKEIVADHIIRLVRTMINRSGSKLEHFYRFANHRVEAMEFYITSESKVTGISLKDLNIKSDILLSYIYRNGEMIVPSGNDKIMVNDRVIVTTTRHYFDEIDDILEV